MRTVSSFRRRQLSFITFLLCCIIISFIACRKEAGVESNIALAKEEAIEIFKTYLNNLKYTGSENGSKQVDKLLSGIDYANVWVEKADNGRHVIAAPLAVNFETMQKISQKHTIYICLLLDNTDNIVKKNIFVYMPETISSVDLPKGVISNLYDNKTIDLNNERLISLSLGGTYKYDLQFENGRLKSKSVPLKKLTNISDDNSTENYEPFCIDWWKTTTYFDSEGTIIREEREYLGRTCYDCGQITPWGQTTECDYLDGDPGTGSGEDTQCNTSCDDALNGWSTTTFKTGQFSSGAETGPDANGIIRKPVVIEGDGVVNNYPLGYSEKHALFFTGVIYKTTTNSQWKWESLQYSEIKSVSGGTPLCVSSNVTASVSGPIISSNKLTATYSASVTTNVFWTCILGSKTGTNTVPLGNTYAASQYQ